MGASVGAQEKSIVQKPEPELVAKPGPLESERRELLAMIYAAKEKGVGIQSYIHNFNYIESVTKQGASSEKLLERINLIKTAIQDQLRVKEFSLTQEKIKADEDNHIIHSVLIDKKGAQEKFLTLNEARNFAVSLINAERKKHKLGPVTIDGIATAAGQKHTDEMAKESYISHWNLVGVKPSQRYTESGGIHNDTENLAYLCSTNPSDLELNNSLFPAKYISTIQKWFMDEKPPNDGHRKNILDPKHNKVGIGISQNKNSHESKYYLAQEFIDEYGQYEKMPLRLEKNKSFQLQGKLAPGLKLYNIEFRLEDFPKAISKTELNKTYSYSEGGNNAIYYWPGNNCKDLKIWSKDKKQHFALTVTPNIERKNGLYYVRVWAQENKSKKSFLVSNRTLLFGEPDNFSANQLRSTLSSRQPFACQREK